MGSKISSKHIVPIIAIAILLYCLAALSLLYARYKKIHCSCEGEDFLETHICELCDTPIARVAGFVSCSLGTQVGDSPLELACTKVKRVMLVSLCAEALKHPESLFLRGTQSDGCGMHHRYVSFHFSAVVS